MNIRKILDEDNFVYKKKYGQNFLIDTNILDNIIKTSEISSKTLVIEIGVGAAALTKRLCQKAKFVLGYEIDEQLKKPLGQILDEYENCEVIFDDFLKRNIKSDIKKYEYEDIMVIANLPYYITTPIITKFVEEKIDVSKIVVMVQNEVANRFSAKTGTKDYGSLSVFLNYYFDIKKAFFVSRNSFYPRPNVDSAVVVLMRKEKRMKICDENIFFKLVKDSFKQKRKTLKNNLKGYNCEIISNVLEKHRKTLDFRAENITIDEFAEISNAIAKQ